MGEGEEEVLPNGSSETEEKGEFLPMPMGGIGGGGGYRLQRR